MAGDVNNTAVWSNADVLIADDLATVDPAAGVDFGAGWNFVGLLDGSAGFGEQQSLDQTDHSAWGYGIIRTTRRNFKLTRTFTALEDSDVVLGLIYDASGVTFSDAGFSGDLAVRDNARSFKIAFELRSGEEIKRYITKGYAQVEAVGEVAEGEDSLQSRPLTIGIYPDDNRNLWSTYKGSIQPDSIAVTPATVTLDDSDGDTQQLAVVATYPDASTADVTELCAYDSSDETKATVDSGGLIETAAAGSSTVTATFLGRTDTCVVTVNA